ncbi:MAG TPA: putative baseplate assembly protein, partial [Patescibacteria group bacterium]|nr:putative baseplate assembly protein [Patescibacteria group bacterium]
MPDWKERHVPDIGVALVEILAYVGDHLSYYQDAVATEAYLATARQRISVRRHARFVDYLMHDGCDARAWVCIQLSSPSTYTLTPSDVWFLGGLDQVPALASKTVLSSDDLRAVPVGTYEVFEPLVADASARIEIYTAHNEISFYTWGNRQCCLPAGARKAVLLDTWDDSSQTDDSEPARKLSLQPGDVLFFEEVKGPVTGNPADADPSRRWAVRLTQVTPTTDSLITTKDGRPTPLVEIEWADADALPLPFCLSARLPAPDCRVISDISVARGNVILVDHGQTLLPCEHIGTVDKSSQTGECACEGSVIEMRSVAGLFRPALQRAPLTFCEPFKSNRPASKMLSQDPRKASPAVILSSIPAAPDGSGPLFAQADLRDATSLAGNIKSGAISSAALLYNRLSPDTKKALNQWDGTGAPPDALLSALVADLAGMLEIWKPKRDLLESGPEDSQFVVEMDDNGVAHLRFGDSTCGRQPEAGMDFLARYRIGNGKAGNIGADRITKIAFRNSKVEGLALTLRNPLPAQGGTEPEPVAEVKLFAPGSFQKVLERAVTADDYAVTAERSPRLQQAKAALRWTGSWYEALVAVDPLASETPDDTLLRHITGHLHPFRRIGHDLAVEAAHYVSIQLAMTVCVLPQYLRGHVEAVLLDVFSNRVLPNGKSGFFHPDNLTFGEGVYLSAIIAAAQAVPGVQNVKVTTFQRLFDPPNNELNTGVLPLGP